MSDALTKYAENAYLLKLRLLQSRQLLDGERNLFCFEQACLFMRKIVESVSHLCLISSEIHFRHVPRQVMRSWNADDIFAFLEKKKLLKFPSFARLRLRAPATSESKPQIWQLEIRSATSDEIVRVRAIYKNAQFFLHEYNPYVGYPFRDSSFQEVLSKNFENIRIDHTWLWNRLWQHGFVIGHSLFIIDMREPRTDANPIVVASEQLMEQTLEWESYNVKAISPAIQFH